MSKVKYCTSCVVLVATVRALKMHGGIEKKDLKYENIHALKKGMVNLERHIDNIKKFGLEPIVAINHFVLDTNKEIETIKEFCKKLNVEVSISTHWSDGGKGARFSKKVARICGRSNKEI